MTPWMQTGKPSLGLEERSYRRHRPNLRSNVQTIEGSTASQIERDKLESKVQNLTLYSKYEVSINTLPVLCTVETKLVVSPQEYEDDKNMIKLKTQW